jgi:uncharacterized oxidoreductase
VLLSSVEWKMWLSSESSRRLTALVTGGSVGLGLEIARELQARSFDVWICARSQAALEKAVSANPGMRAIQADVAKEEDRRRLFVEINAQTGGRPLDCLINNAAITRAHDYLNPFTLASDRAREEIETNLAAPIELIRLFLLSRRGYEAVAAGIVNISTPGALFPLEASPLYSATKAGLHMFTSSLRRQLAGTPIKVIEVFPPALDTGLASQLNVQAQSANGPEVIVAVARETVAGILDGVEVIMPHEQARQLCDAFPPGPSTFIDQINAGVKRRTGWDRAEFI